MPSCHTLLLSSYWLSPSPFSADTPGIEVSPAAACHAQVHPGSHSLSPQSSARSRQHLQCQTTQDKPNSSITAELHSSS